MEALEGETKQAALGNYWVDRLAKEAAAEDAGFGREQALEEASDRVKWALHNIGWWHERVDVWNDVQAQPEEGAMPRRPLGTRPLALVQHDVQRTKWGLRCLACGKRANTYSTQRHFWVSACTPKPWRRLRPERNQSVITVMGAVLGREEKLGEEFVDALQASPAQVGQSVEPASTSEKVAYLLAAACGPEGGQARQAAPWRLAAFQERPGAAPTAAAAPSAAPAAPGRAPDASAAPTRSSAAAPHPEAPAQGSAGRPAAASQGGPGTTGKINYFLPVPPGATRRPPEAPAAAPAAASAEASPCTPERGESDGDGTREEGSRRPRASEGGLPLPSPTRRRTEEEARGPAPPPSMASGHLRRATGRGRERSCGPPTALPAWEDGDPGRLPTLAAAVLAASQAAELGDWATLGEYSDIEFDLGPEVGAAHASARAAAAASGAPSAGPAASPDPHLCGTPRCGREVQEFSENRPTCLPVWPEGAPCEDEDLELDLGGQGRRRSHSPASPAASLGGASAGLALAVAAAAWGVAQQGAGDGGEASGQPPPADAAGRGRCRGRAASPGGNGGEPPAARQRTRAPVREATRVRARSAAAQAEEPAAVRPRAEAPRGARERPSASAAGAVPPPQPQGRLHLVEDLHGYTVCTVCGAYAAKRTVLLGQPCPGKAERPTPAERERRRRSDRIRDGLHPRTGRPLLQRPRP